MKYKYTAGKTEGNPLTLRKKTMLIIGATLVCLIVILYFTTSTIMMDGFSRLEEQDTVKNVNRVLQSLDDDIADLNGYVGDWAAWDETYTFINDRNYDFVERNIPNKTFLEMRLNLMLYINSSGGVVFGRSFDLVDERAVPVPESLKEYLAADSILLKHDDKYGSVKGIILLPEGPMIVVSRPILDNERKGPIRGSTIWGRYLNEQEIEHLAEMTHLSVTMSQLGGTQMPVAVPDSLSEEKPILVQPLDEQYMAGYTVLKDIYGKPALLLSVEIPRDIYNQGRAGERYLFISLIVVGLVFGGVFIWLLEKSVLARLARLNADVSSIGAKEEFFGRVAIEGRDELSNLGLAINRMLEALERSQLENRCANLEIRERERFMESIFTGIQDGIGILDKDMNIIRVNKTAEKWYPYTTSFVGRKCYEAYHGRSERCEACPAWRTLKTGEVAFDIVQKHGHGGKEVGWVEIYSYPRIDAATGKMNGVIEYVRDITDEKKAEELELENMRLTLASKAKSEFLATMSHELRTPLNSIIGFSELLERVETNEKHKHYAENVISSGKHLLGLIDDILDISRVEAGKIELKYEKVSIPDVIKRSLHMIMETAANRHVLLRNRLDPALEFMETDAVRLRQMLFNLLSNAIKFSKQEGGTVTITTKKEGEMAKFSVSDTGIGIKEEDIGKLFNEFEQLDSGISRKYGGTGLGLAITKKLVELHGGTITVESRYDEGSTFTLSLPLLTKKKKQDTK